MARIKVVSDLRVYEIDGKDTEDSIKSPAPQMRVHSHWSRREFIAIEIAGVKYTVVASDIEAAIKNATNSGGH